MPYTGTPIDTVIVSAKHYSSGHQTPPLAERKLHEDKRKTMVVDF